MSEERCVCCGAVIPEGGQVCQGCLEFFSRSNWTKPRLIDAWPAPIWTCSACHTQVIAVEGYRAKFCMECGRAVKWDQGRKTEGGHDETEGQGMLDVQALRNRGSVLQAEGQIPETHRRLEMRRARNTDTEKEKEGPGA